MLQEVNGYAIQLKKAHDFSWLQSYGKVFAVFDQQDSGNISFGIETEKKRYFIKYAGAETVYGMNSTEEAIQRLKEARRVYEDLHHPTLIEYVEAIERPNGYALVFSWADGENLHPHWKFPPPEKYTHPDSPFYRFKQLSFEKKRKAFIQILSFHQLVADKGYVSIDFYDGSLLYNFKTDTLSICDIDFYRKTPYVNKMGQMWGSTRFMSPEEFVRGAKIDQQTMVFTMGAMAFALFGGEQDRSREKWDASETLYQASLKAVHTNRQERFATVQDFLTYWEKE
ncbi:MULTISPECIES: protein kinase domain-containing protein [Bacillaceae]|uniref:Serine/threonine protein kinase n=2 Tax=Bacillaceae TaxID=186817 RepID=A0A9D5I283_9BACI|nr:MULTISPECIES: serine/threonine protein kinase [Bacillaceae]KQL58457.1 serine/threonine protein kinase [Alkalicoccobacillus plakortidis]MBG9782795.1 serine/threonine protein kinase [Shouchella lehensis]TES49864.1 serine/threonine protein kinase [Shouchella lehensis]